MGRFFVEKVDFKLWMEQFGSYECLSKFPRVSSWNAGKVTEPLVLIATVIVRRPVVTCSRGKS